MIKVAFATPAYGTQPPTWWSHLVFQAGNLHRQGFELAKTRTATSMNTGSNRNVIVKTLLSTSAEYFIWIDML